MRPSAYRGSLHRLPTAWDRPMWKRLLRQSFAGLEDLAGNVADTSTLAIGPNTWTLRNTADAYLDSIGLSSGQLVFGMNAASSLWDPNTGASAPELRCELGDLVPSLDGTNGPFRFAAAFSGLGDANSEQVGIGIRGTNASTGYGFGAGTGFHAGAAGVSIVRAQPTLQGTQHFTGTYSALMVEVYGARIRAWGGTAVGGMPPDPNDPTKWSPTTYSALPGSSAVATISRNPGAPDPDTGLNAPMSLILWAQTGNVSDNFAPAVTGIEISAATGFTLE